MNLIRRLYWVTDTLHEQWCTQRMLNIGSGELVLDVGSGGSPNLRSNVLCDKFATDAAERHGTAVLRDRPFVVADIQRLPFESGSFDFVICSHVLEHVQDPQAAVAELCRVAKRGYIETPSAQWERVAGFAFHRWMVSARRGTLIFERKKAPIQDPAMQTWFEALQANLGLSGYVWWRRRKAGVYTSVLWDGHVAVDIQDEGVVDAEFEHARVDTDVEETIAERDVSRFGAVLASYGRHLRRKSQPRWQDVRRLLRCPRCYGPLQDGPNRLTCDSCARTYRVDDDGIPWLLV